MHGLSSLSLTQIFEKHSKKRVWFGDVYSKEISDLSKGDFVVKVQLLGPNVTALNA